MKNIVKTLMDVHVLVGLAAVALYSFEKPLALLFGFGFLVYEAMQLYKKQDDRSWFNVGGFLHGGFWGSVILISLQVVGII